MILLNILQNVAIYLLKYFVAHITVFKMRSFYTTGQVIFNIKQLFKNEEKQFARKRCCFTFVSRENSRTRKTLIPYRLGKKL